VGGPLIGFDARWPRAGVVGLLALTCAFVDWFAIVFTGRSMDGLGNSSRAIFQVRNIRGFKLKALAGAGGRCARASTTPRAMNRCHGDGRGA
jgi:hypothetical protein